MRRIFKSLPVYAVSGFLSLTMFATNLSAAPRIPRDGGDFTFVRMLARLLRRALDTIGVPIG